jgi:hypothetical protein
MPLTASLASSVVLALDPTTTQYKVTYTAPTGGTGTAVAQANDVTGV